MILKYLVENTGADHGVSALRLTKDLAAASARHMQKPLSERTVREYLHDLKRLGASLPFGIQVRRFKDLGEDTPPPSGGRATDWYASPAISPAQMRLLADALQMSRFHPDDVSDLRALLATLAGLEPERLERGQVLQSDRPMFRGVPATIDILDSAVSGGQKIRFHYAHVVLRQVGPQKDSRRPIQKGGIGIGRYQPFLEKTEKEYEFYPYSMVFKKGDYYLIAGVDPQPGEQTKMFHFVIDRICDIEILDDSAVGHFGTDFDFARYVNERPYFYGGQAVEVEYRVIGGLDGTFSWFPNAQARPDRTAGQFTVRVKVQPDAMVWWALQYAESVEVLSPPELRDRIAKTLEKTLEKYQAKP
ncbi:helix-turn-helix transcriptional regulator [Bifidobacterium tsurumiense]|nr:WYL domain-containing protein [Bifidobacterium tsurumiense]MDY4677840.1 WYL domain-containing protein [Bifidobacterium tsurumiense]